MDANTDAIAHKKKHGGKVFGVGGLAILTFAFLANVNTTPQLATFGLGAIALFVMAIVLFLAPTAMASSEMAAAWPRTGGIYVWTRLAFGEAAGFVIIWLEWAQFVVAWPYLMGSITLQAAYLIDPSLNNNPVFLVLVVITTTWLSVLLALRGLRVTSGFAWYSVIAASVLPAVLLVAFAIVYVVQGNSPQFEVSASALVPAVDFSDIAFISGALLMFAGIQVSANHAGDVENPGRTIPRSNWIAVALCLLLFAPLTLAIATVIPANQINIVSGLVQSAEAIFTATSVGWLTPIFTFLIVTGLIASLVQIINGPSRGLVVAGREGGNLPPFLQRENAQKMPVVIIVIQAAISSVLALGYLVLGSVQNAWIMFALIQTNMVLIMYLMMFAALVKLRYSKPDVKRPYAIPGKKVGVWAVAAIGSIVCLAGLVISFLPTSENTGMSTGVYVLIVALGTIAFTAMPFLFWIFRKPSWKTEELDLNAPDPEAVS